MLLQMAQRSLPNSERANCVTSISATARLQPIIHFDLIAKISGRLGAASATNLGICRLSK